MVVEAVVHVPAPVLVAPAPVQVEVDKNQPMESNRLIVLNY
jgi:hypothetical protein